MDTCHRHPDVEAVDHCRRCSAGVCAKCYELVGGKRFCSVCGTRRRWLRQAQGLGVIAAVAAALVATWWFRSFWMTTRLVVPDIASADLPREERLQEPASAKPDLRQALLAAQARLEQEPCDRRAMREFIAITASFNETRRLLTRAEQFESDCGDWDLLAGVRAEGHAQLSEWSLASAQYDRWVALASQSPVAYAARGLFRKQQATLDGAIADFQAVLLLEPAYTDVPIWLAELLIQRDRPCESIPVLQQLILGNQHLASDPKVVSLLQRARAEDACVSYWGTGGAQVQMMGDDQMLDIDARIGGRPFAAVLDTGASFVTLPRRVAELLELDLTQAKTVQVNVVGETREAHHIVLEELSIGKALAKDVDAIVVDEVFPGTSTILLGMSFLSRFQLHLDPEARTVTLSGKGARSRLQ